MISTGPQQPSKITVLFCLGVLYFYHLPPTLHMGKKIVMQEACYLCEPHLHMGCRSSQTTSVKCQGQKHPTPRGCCLLCPLGHLQIDFHVPAKQTVSKAEHCFLLGTEDPISKHGQETGRKWRFRWAARGQATLSEQLLNDLFPHHRRSPIKHVTKFHGPCQRI